jgi:hypothetical protein
VANNHHKSSEYLRNQRIQQPMGKQNSRRALADVNGSHRQAGNGSQSAGGVGDPGVAVTQSADVLTLDPADGQIRGGYYPNQVGYQSSGQPRQNVSAV